MSTYAVVEALADSCDNGIISEQMAQQDQATSNFLSALAKHLAQFHGDMKAIEAYFQAYSDQHAAGTNAHNLMSMGANLALRDMDNIQSGLVSYDAQIKQIQDKIDEDNKGMDAHREGHEEFEAHGLDYWVGYYAARCSPLLILGPFGIAPAAGAALAAAEAKYKELANEDEIYTSFQADAGIQEAHQASLQQAQATLLQTGTQPLSPRANVLAAQSKGAIDQAVQNMQTSFEFLEGINS